MSGGRERATRARTCPPHLALPPLVALGTSWSRRRSSTNVFLRRGTLVGSMVLLGAAAEVAVVEEEEGGARRSTVEKMTAANVGKERQCYLRNLGALRPAKLHGALQAEREGEHAPSRSRRASRSSRSAVSLSKTRRNAKMYKSVLACCTRRVS